MESTVVADRIVSEDMQKSFAALSGDRNPMHMDAIAARRTQAGRPVVHGIHSVLWALECLAVKGILTIAPTRIRIRFIKWVYIGDLAVLLVPGNEPLNPKKLELQVDGMAVLAVELNYAEITSFQVWVGASPERPLETALDRSIEEFQDVHGDAYTAPAEDAVSSFPSLSEIIGGSAISEIASCSYIVGMEGPGLHSMFSKADLHLPHALESSQPRCALHWEVTYTDVRFRKARIAVSGQSIHGILDVFFRVPPVRQASMELIARYVTPGEFAGMRALVVGGSRGLGELAAKVVAAGGGSATITYAVGRADAEATKEQIRSWGGDAKTMAYDVRKAAASQIRDLEAPPTHLFYFATNTIYRPKQGVLASSVLAEFMQFYVLGFHDLCVALTDPEARTTLPEGKLAVLYPSTVFVDQRPAGMTEYAMVKAAGEQLCADMNIYLPGLQIFSPRLPKLPTDQTAGVIPERETDALEALLPLVRGMNKVSLSE